MRKGWLFRSAVTGIAVSLIADIIIKLSFDMAAREGQLFNRLYEMIGNEAGTLYFQYDLSNGAFCLLMVGLLALEFSAGMLSYLLARDADGDGYGDLNASFVAGLLPALTFADLHLNSWRAGLAQQNASTFVIQPEPAIPGLAIGIIVILMLVCLGSAIAGGVMARYALKRKATGEGA
jgi:hypothetical protein